MARGVGRGGGLLLTLVACARATTVGDTGPSFGWATVPHADEGECTVQRVLAATLKEAAFEAQYLEQQPIIITGLDNVDFRSACAREVLLANWADATIALSTANTFSYDKAFLSLREYVATHMKPQDEAASGSDTLYHFGDNNHTEWDALFSRYRLPPFIPPDAATALSWGLAGPNSGVPFHTHGAGYSEPVHGRKRWFLTPPHVKPAFHPDQTTLTWLHTHYDDVRRATPQFQECTVHPGEAIYFPSEWWHATLNLDESVFMSTFVNYATTPTRRPPPPNKPDFGALSMSETSAAAAGEAAEQQELRR